MNIFAFSNDPYTAAKLLDDRRVNKMLLESVQIISTVCHEVGYPIIPLTKAGTPYKPTHKKHPAVKWAGESSGNLNWLCNYTRWLGFMFNLRFGREHSCAKAFNDWWAESVVNKQNGYGTDGLWNFIPAGHRTDFVQCMPDEYKGRDATSAYKRYFWGEKVDESTRWFKTNFNGEIPSVWGTYLA